MPTNIFEQIKPIPNREVIYELEALLKDAKNGNLQFLVYSTMSNDLMIRGDLVGDFGPYYLAIVGKLEELKMSLMNHE